MENFLNNLKSLKIKLLKPFSTDVQTQPSNLKELENCKNLQDKFTSVYEDNLFEGGESRSGEGSNLPQTEVVRKKIPWLIKEYNIQSFLDAPCGDWYWMQNVDLSGLKQYIGVDIVAPLIDKNNKLFASTIVSFKTMNIAESNLPMVDLILCRDCLVHLSYDDAIKIIKNFKSSGSKYLLTTTFTGRKENIDLGDTFWRTLNMQKPPFNFPKPIMLINENCTEGNNEFTDKCLGLWLLEDIKI